MTGHAIAQPMSSNEGLSACHHAAAAKLMRGYMKVRYGDTRLTGRLTVQSIVLKVKRMIADFVNVG